MVRCHTRKVCNPRKLTNREWASEQFRHRPSSPTTGWTMNDHWWSFPGAQFSAWLVLANGWWQIKTTKAATMVENQAMIYHGYLVFPVACDEPAYADCEDQTNSRKSTSLSMIHGTYGESLSHFVALLCGSRANYWGQQNNSSPKKQLWLANLGVHCGSWITQPTSQPNQMVNDGQYELMSVSSAM